MSSETHGPPDPALDRLYARTAHGVKLGLEYVGALLDQLDHPQSHWAPIHVAGTNGKGSVCAMLAAVLERAGYPTGLYTSPHLVRFNERIRVNGQCIPDADLVALFAELEDIDRQVAAQPGMREATFFEFTTALAFEHFRRRSVALAVLETGLGGRLDATNVVTPLVSVITSIALDHVEYLGRTVAEVAVEKCGIIKPGRPVICGPGESEAGTVIARVAGERGAPLVRVEDAVSVHRVGQTLRGQRIKLETASGTYGPLELPLVGRHQLENCAIAVATIEHLRESAALPIPKKAVEEGLAGVQWPARAEVLSEEPLTILDCAHNPAGARVLLKTVREMAKGRELGMLVGFSTDKDCAGFMRVFGSTAKRCWAVELTNPRGMSMDRVLAGAHAAGLEPEARPLGDAYREASDWAREGPRVVCVTGSIYLAGELMEHLGRQDVFAGAGHG